MSVSPREEFVEGGGGALFFRSWLPEAPEAVVVICHGVNSHSGYFGWAADRFVEQGYAVYALDLRGRGRSDGERFYVEHIQDYVDDLARVIRTAKGRHPGLPVILLGHSAGGVVSCTYCLDHQAELSGFVCESFAFQVPAPDVALAVVKGLSHLLPHAPALKLHNKDFSRDAAAVQAMDDDPLIKDEAQPSATVAALVRADEHLKVSFGEIKLPVMILHGTADKATRPSGSQMFFDRAGSPDKTLKLYEGHAHDLLNDLGREGVMADIESWIAPRVH